MTIRAKAFLTTIIFLIFGVLVAGGIYHRKAIGEWFKETFPSKQTVNTLKKENEKQKEEISSLQNNVSNLGNEVSTLQASKTTLTNQLAEVNLQLQNSNETNEQLIAEKTSLELKLNEVNEKLNKVYSKIETIYTKNNLNVSNLSSNQDEAINQKLEAISNYIDTLSTQEGTFFFTTETAYLMNGCIHQANNTTFHSLYLSTSTGLKTYDFWKIYSTTLGIDNLDLSTVYLFPGFSSQMPNPTRIFKTELKHINVTSEEWTGSSIVENKTTNEITDFTFKVYLDGVEYNEMPAIDFSNIERVVWVYNETTNNLSWFYMSTNYILSQDYAFVG